MLRQYATRHALASQKGQRETDVHLRVLPREQRGTPEEEAGTRTEESRATIPAGTRTEESRATTPAGTTPETIRRREQMCDLLRVSSDGAPQTRTSLLRHHLSPPGLPASTPVPIPSHEDVLLQTKNARPVSLCVPGLPIRVHESTSKEGMEMSSLPSQSDRCGEQILSKAGQRQTKLVRKLTHASDVFQEHGKGLCQIDTTPVPFRRPSYWDRFYVTLFRTMYLYPFARDYDVNMILFCLALLNVLVG